MDIIVILAILFLLAGIAVIDYQSYRIPNQLVLALLAVASLCRLLGLAPAAFLSCLLAAVLPWAFSCCIGMGDVKLLSVLGFCFGFEALLFTCLAAFLGAGMYAAALLAFFKAEKKDRFAFGPFIAASAAVYLVYLSV